MPRISRRDQFQRLARKLRKAAPTQHPVRIRRESAGKGRLADCALEVSGRSRRFVIRIRPEARFQEALDSLIHEWAHALAWSVGHPTLTDHDEVWGVCLSKAYRAVFPDPGPDAGNAQQ